MHPLEIYTIWTTSCVALGTEVSGKVTGPPGPGYKLGTGALVSEIAISQWRETLVIICHQRAELPDV